MSSVKKTPFQESSVAIKKNKSLSKHTKLVHLAFNNSAQPNLISQASNGKIIMVNRACCKLLDYSSKELLTKSRADIVNIEEASLKKLLQQRASKGQAAAVVTIFKKGGGLLTCRLTSALFMDEDGIEKAITTITDISGRILEQKNIDTKKDKIVADNITEAKFKQKNIDVKKDKTVADNISIAKSKQKKIDIKKDKIVAGNIILAKKKQKSIDIKKDKIVADNIVIAKSKQKNIDIKKDKMVAGNIMLAKKKQDNIDLKKEKTTSGNIIIAQARVTEWKKNMGKTSYDVMWEWDIATDQIYVGDSVHEVFGYEISGNSISFSQFIEKVFPEEKERFKKKLLKTLASGSLSWDDAYTFIKQDGSAASTISRAIILRNEEGKALHLIGATMDTTTLQKLNSKAELQKAFFEKDNEKFVMASKLSYDVIWDWNLLTNEVYRGDGFNRMLGYTKKNKSGHITDWRNNLHPDDKDAVEEKLQAAIASADTHWEHAFRFIKADGSVAIVLDRATIMREADGKAYRMIGVMHDLTEQKKLEEKLQVAIAAKEKSKESFKLIYNSSTDLLYDVDLVANSLSLSDAYEKEFGYKITPGMTLENSWLSHIHPDDKETVTQNHKKRLASGDTEWNYNYRFLRADDSVVNVKSSGIILRKADGKAYRMIGSLQDISKLKDLEETLKQEIYLKEKQIEEAMQEARDTQRADIGKELHDNVNQLLGASKMYIELAKRGGENSEMYLSRSSEYTLTAIEEIRKLTKGLVNDFIKNLGLCESIETLAKDTMEVSPVKITCLVDGFKEQSVHDKFKLTLYRIVQEQLNNILKHAKAKKVTISLLQNNKWIKLSMTDDGIGFNTANHQNGIGIANIRSRAAAYNGTAAFVSKPGHGCVLNVTFPLLDELMINK